MDVSWIVFANLSYRPRFHKSRPIESIGDVVFIEILDILRQNVSPPFSPLLFKLLNALGIKRPGSPFAVLFVAFEHRFPRLGIPVAGDVGFRGAPVNPLSLTISARNLTGGECGQTLADIFILPLHLFCTAGRVSTHPKSWQVNRPEEVTRVSWVYPQ